MGNIPSSGVQLLSGVGGDDEGDEEKGVTGEGFDTSSESSKARDNRSSSNFRVRPNSRIT